MTDARFLDPLNYKVGAKDIGQFEWLDDRLTLHGHPLTKYDDMFKRRVQNFQLAQNWTGSGADGYVGKETLRRLSLDPVIPNTINLSRWKWTGPIPLGGDSPIEVKQPALSAYEKPPYFDRLVGGAILFRAPVSGATTPTSDYPRSELREMNLDGSNAKWNSADKHELVIEQAVTALPAVKKHVVVGQIHDKVDDVIMIRLEGTHLFVESRGEDIGLLDINYQLGTRFRITISTDIGGIYVYYNGVKKATLRGQFADCYYKAGVYTQAYAGQEYHGEIVPDDAYGEAIIYGLDLKAA